MSTDQIVFIISTFMACSALIWVIYRAGRINKATLFTAGFVGLFGLATAFQVRIIYEGITLLTNVNNLAWLLSYTAGTVAIYLLAEVYSEVTGKTRPIWIRYALLVTLSLLVSLFPLIANQPQSLNHTYPTSLSDLLFMQTFYLYAAGVCFLLFRNLFHLLSTEHLALHTQLRWLMGTISAISGLIFFASRMLHLFLVYTWPSVTQMPAVATLDPFTTLFFQICAVSWGLFLLPNHIFQRISQPLLFADKLRAFYDLRIIANNVAAYCPATVPGNDNGTLQARLQNPDFHLYRAIITILDGKHHLSNHLRDDGPETLPPEARNLLALLNNVDDWQSYSEVLTAYRQIGQRLQRERRNNRYAHLFATYLSRLFHPFIVPVPVLLLAMLLIGLNWLEAVKWAGLSFTIAVLPLLLFVMVNVRQGRYTDMDVSIREHRYGLYALAIVCFTALIVILNLLGAPRIAVGCLYAAAFAIAVGALINHAFTKISLHSVAMAGCAAVLFFVSPAAGAILSLIALLVGWSRIHLNRHTPGQVLLGWLVAAVCVAIMLPMFIS